MTASRIPSLDWRLEHSCSEAWAVRDAASGDYLSPLGQRMEFCASIHGAQLYDTQGQAEDAAEHAAVVARREGCEGLLPEIIHVEVDRFGGVQLIGVYGVRETV